MLLLKIESIELYDEISNEFITSKATTIQLEHSLVSLSKWESKWNKPFLTSIKKTTEETLDYIKCMTVTPNVPDDVYDRLTQKNFEEIRKYIDSPMSATVINKVSKSVTRETITSELIYCWMVSYSIPFECQKWHINRLITLINLLDVKNNPQKKQSKNEILKRNHDLNEARKAKYGTEG